MTKTDLQLLSAIFLLIAAFHLILGLFAPYFLPVSSAIATVGVGFAIASFFRE